MTGRQLALTPEGREVTRGTRKSFLHCPLHCPKGPVSVLFTVPLFLSLPVTGCFMSAGRARCQWNVNQERKGERKRERERGEKESEKERYRGNTVYNTVYRHNMTFIMYFGTFIVYFTLVYPFNLLWQCKHMFPMPIKPLELN